MRFLARPHYALLAILAVWAFGFQTAVSIEQIRSLLAGASSGTYQQAATAWILGLNLGLITPFACLLVGFYVAAVRIWDRRAWLLLAALLSFSVLADGSQRHDTVMQWPAVVREFALLYRSVLIMGWPLCMVLFAIYFPERAQFDRRRPGLKWFFLVPALLMVSLAVVRRVAFNENWTGGIFPLVERIDILLRPFQFQGFLLLFLIVLARKLVTAKDPDEQRRLRVLFLGLGLSFVPALGTELFTTMFLHKRLDQLPAWVLLPTLTLFVLFPLTLAYVTVVWCALGARELVRQSVQYALARNGVLVLQLAFTLLMIVLVATVSGQGAFLERVFVTALGAAAILAVGFGARRIALWIDRSFFRESYNAEQILRQLADSVASMVELRPMLEVVAARISEALHISRVAVFLPTQGQYCPALVTQGDMPETTISGGSQMVARLVNEREPLRVYRDDPRSWTRNAAAEEKEVLGKLETEILVPFSRKDELMGFVSLGPRLADAPYSARDLQLLQSVAQQTALAIDNSRLTSKIAAETAAREIISRELSIARDVQQLLFPQVYPNVPGVAYCGACRPAREVGGDYYDIFELPKGLVGLAIGDIAGKGIPASLLMASLQASLRGQTMIGRAEIDLLMANINKLVYAASPSNRYATFFYAEFDPATRRLSYVNAGHNPPLLLRNGLNKGHVERLEASGPPVGLFPQAQYQGATLELHAGDVLALFTDGISEAMNPHEEEWGEERLLEVLQTEEGGDPQIVVEKVFAAADAFSAGAPQHDDMTLAIFAVRN